MPLLDLVDNDSLLHILQYVHADQIARVGLSSKKWCEKIYGGGTSNKIWNSFAFTRWGDECVSIHSQDNQHSSAASSSSSWYEYYRHRCTWIAQPVSNLDLIQEYYGHDPYKLLELLVLKQLEMLSRPSLKSIQHPQMFYMATRQLWKEISNHLD